MKRSELVLAISQQYPDVKIEKIDRFVRIFFDCLAEAIARGETVRVRGLCSFHARYRRPRLGRNPKTGAQVSVSSKRVPFFQASRTLKALVNRQVPLDEP